jgi:hypothetical protein
MPIYPNDYVQPPLQLRRSGIAKVSDYVAAEGELVYSTNTNQLFIGDGVTVGGILVTNAGQVGSLDFGTFSSPAGFSLDMGSF